MKSMDEKEFYQYFYLTLKGYLTLFDGEIEDEL